MDQIIKKKLVRNWFKTLQDVLCKEIEELENKQNLFKYKNWERGKKSNEGGGQYRILENGKIFEKVGVNFSEVHGKFSKQFRKKIPGALNNPKFWASGISVVMHMRNPHVPAMHFNTRYIYTSHGWFGGGIDLTPCLKDKRLEKWFHNQLKKSCDKYNKNFYKKYKKWCDQYFYLPHRNESRGIGGIFFDYKKENWEKDFSFVREIGICFKNIFREIVIKKNKIK
jgi:coproporphyrinogen III oxidase